MGERERDLNGEWGPTSFLNGRERVTEFEWGVGPYHFKWERERVA